jgi:hypothetical protein
MTDLPQYFAHPQRSRCCCKLVNNSSLIKAVLSPGEGNRHKRDEIVARQLSALNEYRGRQEKPLRLSDIKEMFEAMRDEA